MKIVVYIFVMCSLAILGRTHAEAQEHKTDVVESNRDEMETMKFLLRSDSVMLSSDVNILKNIDSTSVNEFQKEYYKYLLSVLNLSEAIKATETEHQELLDLEKRCAEKKKELSSQVSTLISTNNRIIRTIKASKQVLSEEHRLFINKMTDRVRFLEKCYVLPSKPNKKRK